MNIIHDNTSLAGFPFNVLVDLRHPNSRLDFTKLEKDVKDTLEAQAKFRTHKVKFENGRTPKPVSSAKTPEIQQDNPVADDPEKTIADSGFYDILKAFTNIPSSEMNIDKARQVLFEYSATEMSLIEFFNYLCDPRRGTIQTAVAWSQAYFLEKGNVWAEKAKEPIERTYKGNKSSFSYMALVETALTWDQENYPIPLQTFAMHCISDPFYEETLSGITMYGHTLKEIIDGEAPFSQAMKELFKLDIGEIPKSEILPAIDCLKVIGEFMGVNDKEFATVTRAKDWASVIGSVIRNNLDEEALSKGRASGTPSLPKEVPHKGGDLDRS